APAARSERRRRAWGARPELRRKAWKARPELRRRDAGTPAASGHRREPGTGSGLGPSAPEQLQAARRGAVSPAGRGHPTPPVRQEGAPSGFGVANPTWTTVIGWRVGPL